MAILDWEPADSALKPTEKRAVLVWIDDGDDPGWEACYWDEDSEGGPCWRTVEWDSAQDFVTHWCIPQAPNFVTTKN